MEDRDNDTRSVFSSRTIWFDPSPALLGLDTNGAAPQRIYGLIVEAEIDEHDGKPIQSFWMKAATDKNAENHSKSDYVMFTDSAAKMEAVLGAIIGASVTPGYHKLLAERVDGYANPAQIAFDDETPEECIEGLQCVVSSAAAGFSLKLVRNSDIIASVLAKLSPQGIEDAIETAGEMRNWAKESIASIEKILSERPTDRNWSLHGTAGDYSVWHDGEVYQVTMGDEPSNGAGYRELGALLSLKGLGEGDFVPAAGMRPA